MSTSIKWVFLAVFCLVAVLLWRGWRDKQASAQWPFVDGVIQVCEAQEDVPYREHDMPQGQWRLNLRYTYEVAGQPYQGDRLRAMAERFPTEAQARQHEAAFRPGQRVKVYYDPAKPSSSVLIPG